MLPRYAGLSRAGLAQLVEHLICNQGVAGSIPAAGTMISMGYSDFCVRSGQIFFPV
jgi:hypothetical protein